MWLIPLGLSPEVSKVVSYTTVLLREASKASNSLLHLTRNKVFSLPESSLGYTIVCCPKQAVRQSQESVRNWNTQPRSQQLYHLVTPAPRPQLCSLVDMVTD